MLHTLNIYNFKKDWGKRRRQRKLFWGSQPIRRGASTTMGKTISSFQIFPLNSKNLKPLGKDRKLCHLRGRWRSSEIRKQKKKKILYSWGRGRKPRSSEVYIARRGRTTEKAPFTRLSDTISLLKIEATSGQHRTHPSSSLPGWHMPSNKHAEKKWNIIEKWWGSRHVAPKYDCRRPECHFKICPFVLRIVLRNYRNMRGSEN